MYYKVYYDNEGNIHHKEELTAALFFIPDGEEIEKVDISDPINPKAILKGSENLSTIMPPFMNMQNIENEENVTEGD